MLWKQSLVLIGLLFCVECIHTQNIHAQAFTGINRTNYKSADYPNIGYLATGLRLGLGLNVIQIGAELEQNLFAPIFQNDSLSYEDELDNSYYGAFFRVNLSSLPAYRFGIVVKGGVGVHQTVFNRNFIENNIADIQRTYDNTIGYHFGFGFSTPIKNRLHFDFNYQYNWLKRPELDIGIVILSGYRAGYHAFQFGVSFNLVIGKAAEKARMIIAKRGW